MQGQEALGALRLGPLLSGQRRDLVTLVEFRVRGMSAASFWAGFALCLHRLLCPSWCCWWWEVGLGQDLFALESRQPWGQPGLLPQGPGGGRCGGWWGLGWEGAWQLWWPLWGRLVCLQGQDWVCVCVCVCQGGGEVKWEKHSVGGPPFPMRGGGRGSRTPGPQDWGQRDNFHVRGETRT